MEAYNALFIGIDVGTGSARGALVTDCGKVLRIASKPIQTWNPSTDHYEQSSDDIWNACVSIIKEIIQGYPPSDIKGIGFDATCSLVVLSNEFKPLTVSLTGKNNQNIILWMDHRAKLEADIINQSGNQVLNYVGGKVSLEMQMPKLMWLKRNMPTTWKNVGYLFDLPDFLTWKATGSNSRSLCSVVCKWNYEVNNEGEMGWNKSFFNEINLNELLENDCSKIGMTIVPPGTPCGDGLSKPSSLELGLVEGTPIGTSIIDAHSGGIGMLGTIFKGVSSKLTSRLALICGTSTCHMVINKSPIFVPGIWGPYFSAMVPEYWLNEAGQSASGILIEHIINSHPASNKIKEKCGNGKLVQDYLHDLIEDLAKRSNYSNSCYLTKDFHMWPDYHGNRSPIADPSLLGMVSGLKLSNSEEDLAITYLATLQSLSYGTKHIIEHLTKAGYENFESLLICGGLSKNKLYVQIQSDVVGVPLLSPEEPESVLLGAAMLGACGSRFYPNLETAMSKMSGNASVVYPVKDTQDYHNRKYKVFLKMLGDQQIYKKMMTE